MFFGKTVKLCLALGMILQIVNAHENEWDAKRTDGHAPIGVMGDHTHQKGEWMLSYRFMHMEMEGNRDNTQNLTENEVLSRYMVSPLSMDMDMHMLGAMYAPTDKLTLMVMAPFLDMSMDHITRTGVRFTTESQGIGDVSLSGLWNILEGVNHRLHATIGVSLPTGSIEKRDDIPVMANAVLPYPMQLGTGTYNFMPGITFTNQWKRSSMGIQLSGRIPVGENSRDYSVGEKAEIQIWGARVLSPWASLSARISGRSIGNYDGRDAGLNPNMVPTADPNLRGGDVLDIGLGTNFKVIHGHRLAVEALFPAYQKLDGPQLKTDWQVTAGWQFSW